MNDLGL